MQDFFNRIRFYIFSGEFLFFLAFLILAVPLIFLGFSYSPRNFAAINLIGFLIIAAIVFISGFILSQKRFSLEIGHRRLNSIVNNLRDGIVSYSEEFRILSFNPAAEQIFNLKKEEVIGLIISPQLSSNPKFKALSQVFFPSLAPSVSRKSEPGVYPQIIDISFSDPRLELRVSTDGLVSQKGEIIGFVKIVHNRTRELEVLKSKSEFVTVAAHQLRTPLTAVNWVFEVLKNSKSIDKSDLEMVITGSAAGLKLLNIIDDLLDVAKIEEGRFGYNFESIDIVAFLESAVRSFIGLAKNYGISISFNKPPSSTTGGQSIMILADPKKLNMVVSNILDNAIKYNVKNGQVIVDLQVLSDKPYVQISIKDTGVGMSGEDLSRLFSKFHRGENALKLQTEGSGLGLYIVKNIIFRHGGQVWAESILNRGTTFYFVLPIDPKLIPQKEIAYLED